MEPTPPVLRLHQIHSRMPIGYTNFVPEEETRNLRASLPESDILQPFKEATGSQQTKQENFEFTDKLVYPTDDQTLNYCNDLSSCSLSHPNYRQLVWSYAQGDYEDSFDFGRRTKGKKNISRQSLYMGLGKPSNIAEMKPSQLESKYRSSIAIPFCLNPQAASLIHHSTVIDQRKRVAQELGSEIIYINDRSRIRSMENYLADRWERLNELEHKIRTKVAYNKERSSRSPDLDVLCSQATSKATSTQLIPLSAKSKGTPSQPGYTRGVGTQDEQPELLEFEGDDGLRKGTLDVLTTEDIKTKATVESAASDVVLPPSIPSAIRDSAMAGLAMEGLYEEAVKSITSRPDIKRRLLKYKNLSWER